MDELQAISSILKRERQARKAAEQVIEERSRELFRTMNALRQLNENLEATVEKRTEEFLQAKENAEAATIAKSAFLSSMSHEIRTPLNAISGLSELIEKDTREPEVKEYASIIRDSVGHLLVIINEILDFSKIESGKFHLEPKDFLLQEIRQQIFHTYAPLARKKGLQFRIEFDQAIPAVLLADKTKLLQIWINLIGNAIKFTKKGSVVVSLHYREKKEGKIWLRGSVRDTGPGISESEQEKIFLPFEQADQTSEQKIGGTGLGLAISGSIIRLMEGSIRLISQPGKGSEFIFDIAVQEGNPDLVSDREGCTNNQEEQLPKGLKILVVDDMEMNRFLMKKVLKRIHAEAFFAHHGEEAIELLRKQSVDIVLMDLHMPVMDGREATRVIRREQIPTENPEVPIIALTADAFQKTAESVIAAGMNDFLPKPIDIEQFYAKLKEIL